MKNLKMKLKNKKAITLIALVITIVILIILAGVTISLTLSNNGLFTRAKQARQEYLNAQAYEELQIAEFNNSIDSLVNSDREKLVSDYTTNMLYKTNFATMKDGENGVTIPSSGITINKQGNYASFNGTNYITIAHDTVDPDDTLVGTTNKTITCWYKTTTSPADSRVLIAYGTSAGDNGRSVSLSFYNHKLQAHTHYGKCDRVLDPANRFDGKWHFLVGVWTGGNKVRFYFDNVAFENTGTYSTISDVLTIGGDNSESNAEVTADIGEVRIYNSALSDDNVEQLYKYGRQTYYAKSN